MKTSICCLSLTAILSCVPLVCRGAQPWQTVDSFPGESRGIVAGQGSHLWTVATVSSSDGTNLVRHSADSGATWTTVSKFPGGVYKLATDPAGRLYLHGTLSSQGVVFRSADLGATWALVLSFTSSAPGSASVRGMAFDVSSNIFVVLRDWGPDSRQVWKVLKGVADATATNGIAWSESDRYTGDSLSISYAVVTRPSPRPGSPDEVFVGGKLIMSDTTLPSYWVIRKSVDAGATWTTADTFQLPNSGDNWISALAVDGAGALYAVGPMGATSRGWLVRKSMDGGMTWTNLEFLTQISGNTLFPYAVAADAIGRIFVVGFGGGLRWHVRSSSDGGTTWASEDFVPAGATGSVANSVTIDAFGNVFVAGRVDNSTSSSAYVRRLLGPPRLVSTVSASQCIISWRTNAPGFVLQSATTLTNGGNWQNSSLTSTVTNGQNVVTMSPTSPAAFFRLRQP